MECAPNTDQTLFGNAFKYTLQKYYNANLLNFQTKKANKQEC